jgi:hypothetical protein
VLLSRRISISEFFVGVVMHPTIPISFLSLFCVSFAAAFASASNHAYADVIVGPFSSNGTYNLIPNGSFETGSMTSFGDVADFRGVFRASTERSLLGSYSAIGQTKTNFVGAGYAAISGRLTVTPGAQYVLSGFFYTAGLQSGFLYLDLDDVGFDVHVFAPNKVSQWQFAYRTFTPTNNYVNVRLIRDGSVAAGSGNVFVNQFGFVDGVAVTPLSAFSPAVAIPEPGSGMVIISVTLGFAVQCWNKRCRSRAQKCTGQTDPEVWPVERS